MSQGRQVPIFTSALSEEAISFCTEVIDSSGVADEIEALLAKKTGRPRHLKVRAVLVALLLLAVDDRPLHLKAATKLLFLRLPDSWRARLGISGDASGRKAFLARYRQVRYLFHLVLAAIDPSVEPKDKVLPKEQLEALRKKLTQVEVAARQKALGKLVGRPARGVGEGVQPRGAGRLRRLGRPGRYPGAAVVTGAVGTPGDLCQ